MTIPKRQIGKKFENLKPYLESNNNKNYKVDNVKDSAVFINNI